MGVGAPPPPRHQKAMTYGSMLDHSNPLFRDLELLKLTDIHSLQLLYCQSYITPDLLELYVMFHNVFSNINANLQNCREINVDDIRQSSSGSLHDREQ